MTDQVLIDAERQMSETAAPRPAPSGRFEITPFAPSAPLTPMAMLGHAIASNAGMEMVEKLMGLQERWEANNARKAFSAAFAAFKSEAVTVVRNRRVTDGPLKNKAYAELFAFVDAATPALSKHGLSATWDITKDEKDWIEVTCIIEHELGHSKRVAFGAPPDTGPGRNVIQARKSTVSYLERITFKAATGLSEQGDDDDGNGNGGGEERLSPVQIDQRIAGYKASLKAAKTLDELNEAGAPIAKEPKAVQDGLRAVWKDEVARLTPKSSAAEATNGNGKGKVHAPPPPDAEGAPTADKPGGSAWMKKVRAAFSNAADRDTLLAAWDTHVEAVKNDIPQVIYDELVEGVNERSMELSAR